MSTALRLLPCSGWGTTHAKEAQKRATSPHVPSLGFLGWVEYTVCLRTRRRELLYVRTLSEMIHDIPGVSRACPSSRMDI